MKKSFNELLNLADILASDINIESKKKVAEDIFPILKEFPKYLCNHPGHLYSNVFDHTMASIEFFNNHIKDCNEFNDYIRKIMLIILLLHDTGKMKTWSIDENGLTHYKGHPHQSAIITEYLLNEYDMDESTRRMIIKLVEVHDDYAGYNCDLSVKEMIDKIGIKEMAMLIRIQRADMSSHADYYKNEFNAKLDKIEILYNDILKNSQA